MGNIDSGLVDLNWRERGDYLALDEPCRRMSFDDALSLVSSSVGISASDVEINDLGGIDSRSSVPDEDDALISKRAETWSAVMGGLLSSGLSMSSDDICMQLSRDLGVVSGGKFAEPGGALDGVVSRNPDELGRLYHLTTLLVLLRERAVFKRVSYVEPRLGLELPDDLRGKLAGILSGPSILEDEKRVVNPGEVDVRDIAFLNHEILQRHRRHFSEAGKYPIERVLRQDPEKISEYCYALLRLILGKSENFSEVLQESFILGEVISLAQRYFPACYGGTRSLWDAEISRVVEQLRDLRVRAFEHNCLMTCRVPTSGIITPPGRLVGPGAKIAVDFGSGPFARFFNAVARGNPGCECFAIDKKIRTECDLGPLGSPNMHFVPGDLDSKDYLDCLVKRFSGNVDMANLANILQKLKYPIDLLKAVFGKMLREHGGVANICVPAISDFKDDSGRHVGMRSLVAMGREDDTYFWESFLTIETLLNVIQSMNMKIMSIALTDSRLAENDMAKRLFVALGRD